MRYKRLPFVFLSKTFTFNSSQESFWKRNISQQLQAGNFLSARCSAVDNIGHVR